MGRIFDLNRLPRTVRRLSQRWPGQGPSDGMVDIEDLKSRHFVWIAHCIQRLVAVSLFPGLK